MYSVVGQGYDKRPERKKKPAISSGTVGTCSVISGSSGVGSGGAPVSVVVVGGGGGGSGVAGLGVGKGGKSILTGGPVGLVVSDSVGVKSSGKNIKSSAASDVDAAEKGGEGKAKSNKGGGGENDKGANGEASDKSAKVGNGEDGASCGPSDAQQDGGVEDGTEKKKEHHHHHHHHHHVDNRPFLQRLFSLIRRLYGTEKEEGESKEVH
ncbi:PE-PGRS family protein PE_PGRS61-like [Palaemon carinicauda]|uniref:PE-PGRS family protein PE_PGRS61-like n=1 Tax=Palaemon carinicauda TaxID=392227 RepID=UPI0035B59BEF